MKYLACLTILLENRLMVCDNEEAARTWLRKEIKKEKTTMPFHDWNNNWVIFSITDIIKDNSRLP